MVMVFVYAIYAAFAGMNDRGNNFGILLFWSVFWPSAIMISAVTVGKVWCAVCPLGAITRPCSGLASTGWCRGS